VFSLMITLCIESNSLGKESAIALGDALTKNKSLEILELCKFHIFDNTIESNELGDEGVNYLIQSLVQH
jgi:hypothetical protein